MPSVEEESRSAESAGERLLDGAELLKRVDGDLRLLSELIELFRLEEPRRVMAIKTAIAQRDRQALTATTDAFDTSLQALSAGTASELTRKLEAVGRAGEWSEAAVVCAALEEELGRLKQSFAMLQMQQGATETQ